MLNTIVWSLVVEPVLEAGVVVKPTEMKKREVCICIAHLLIYSVHVIKYDPIILIILFGQRLLFTYDS